MGFNDLIEDFEEEPLTRQMILSALEGYKRPNDKIGELIKSGFLTSVKNGLYVPGPASKIKGPESFLIANHLWGPSYVSLESALSFFGFIPERVYEVSSVTSKVTKSYKTAVGRFTYRHAPLPYYSFGIRRVELTPRQSVLIASAEKALCDKIIMTAGVSLRSTLQTRDFLLEDMRMDEEMLMQLDLEKIDSWTIAAPKKDSLRMLTKTLRDL